jgi:hypothetical protein
MKSRLLLLIVLIMATAAAHSQDSLQRFKSAGAITGFGFKLNIDTRYDPIYFAGDFSWQFGKTRRTHFLAFYLEPQFNLVLTQRPVDIEFGSNIGFRYYQKLSDKLYVYEMLGSGPHYITADLPRQAKGFIFSDNLAFGLYTRVNTGKSLFLNTQIRIRHISNAGIKLPNSGVNTFNILIGLAKFK